jgi:ATP-dependent protease ClpP protease subunit
VNEFDEDALAKFSEDMSSAHETGQDVVPILVDSFGGDPYTVLGMIAVIERSRLPVVTVVEAKAMSAGAFLFTFGRERYIAPDATLMFHGVSQFTMDEKKASELRTDANESDRLQQLLFSRTAAAIGKPKDFFVKMFDENKHADMFMNAREAKRQNIATHIGVPSFSSTIAVTHRFAVDGSQKTAVSSYRQQQKPLSNAARATTKVRSK